MDGRTLLIAAATPAELAPLVDALGDPSSADARVSRFTFRSHRVEILTTGIGMVATAAWTSRALARASYDLALNFGVCGSFDRALAPGTVVHVTSDRIAELGAEDGDDTFLSLAELELAGEDVVVNHEPPANHALAALPSVTGITVNTVHGSDRTIARVAARFAPRVESMEGAAFMYACAVHGVPYAQVRAVSNIVERRNRSAWRLSEAIAGLNAVALEILQSL